MTEIYNREEEKLNFANTKIKSFFEKNIPEKLKTYDQWVLHKNKIPFDPKTLKPAKAGNPKTWSDFTLAFEKYTKYPKQYDGLGFEFNNNGLIGIDLDTVRNPKTGAICAEAAKIINQINSYTEISPSGFGLHIICEASNTLFWNKTFMDSNNIIRPEIDKKTGFILKNKSTGKTVNKKPEIEIYNKGRFFTVTGNIFKNFTEIQKRDEEIQKLISDYSEKVKDKVTQIYINTDFLKIGLEKDKKFKNLWDGNRPIGNESSDDMSLMSKLAYWLGKDKEKMISAFLSSPHFSQKNIKHIKKASQRKDYLERTAQKAINNTSETAEFKNKIYNIVKKEEIRKKKEKNKDYNYNYSNQDYFNQDYTDINFEDFLWIKPPQGKEKPKVLCPELAEHIRINNKYIFVREGAKGAIGRFFYMSGFYKAISDEEMKGIIKSFIPLKLQKIKDIVEVMNLLYTDLVFKKYSDLNPSHLINFKNGTFDIKTWSLRAHSPDDFCTIQVDCEYKNDVQAPENSIFDNFMNHLTAKSEGLKNLILQFMGVSISNIEGYRMKKSMFMVGKGDTGKSQCKELLTKLIGVENTSGIDLKTLESRFGTSQIYNKRLAGSNDMSFNTINELTVFKQVTGGDTIFAEYKGDNGFSYRFNGVMWFCCNKLPRFGGDKGKWVYDRIVVAPCNNVVDKKDVYILDKMYTEKDYIVSTIMNSLKKVIQNGYKYDIPEECIKANKAYQIVNNNVLEFLEGNTEARKEGKILPEDDKAVFYKAYKAWCNENGYGKPLSSRNVALTLESRGDFVKISGHVRYWAKTKLSENTKLLFK